MSIADRIFEDGIMEDENSRTDLNFGDRYYRGDDEQYCYNKTEDKFETINERNEKMGRMKEEFMQMRMQEQEDEYEKDYFEYEKTRNEEEERYVDEAEHERNEIIDAMYDVAQQPSINQLNNKKMKKVESTIEVKETKEETLKRLFLANGLVKEDVYKDKRGFVIITRTGIDKIVSKQNITVAYEPVVMEKDWVVMRATASMQVGHKSKEVRNMMSFGEASDSNLMGGGKKFPVAMAEKRAMSRVVLKVAGFYEQGVFGQDEIVD